MNRPTAMQKAVLTDIMQLAIIITVLKYAEVSLMASFLMGMKSSFEIKKIAHLSKKHIGLPSQAYIL